ncbi:MAG: hypothetical protein ABSG17_13345 [Spirochaetia bacterium]|jgi:hypothetical protein
MRRIERRLAAIERKLDVHKASRIAVLVVDDEGKVLQASPGYDPTRDIKIIIASELTDHYDTATPPGVVV